MKLYNTLTKQKETLQPLKPGQVSLYTCGPTVYHYMQIGNLRKYVFDDVLRRTLQASGLKVDHVMNITDVGHLTSDADEGDDKLQSRAAQEGKTVWEVADYYTKSVLDDFATLNILPAGRLVKATDAIDQQLKMVQVLMDKGFAYQTEQAIYFDVTRLNDYGKLSGQKLEDKETAARAEVVTDAAKHHPWDFAVWFFMVGHFAHHEMRWPSPWGEGFPGWHLECSAIIERELGITIDIHTGGVDHIGTHHTNEIAQSEAAHDGAPLANIWVHQEFLTVDGGKMSKSRGTAYRLSEVIDKGYDSLALRLLYLQSHYRTQQNFTWEILDSARNALDSIYAWSDLQFQGLKNEATADSYRQLFGNFVDAMQNDLDTPTAYRLLMQMVGEDNPDSDATKQYAAKLDTYLGLGLADRQDISDGDKKLIARRQQARENKDFLEADKLRKQLAERGLEIDDTLDGPRWRRIYTA
jgi:cysteinyl-tRNA synthetase